MLASEPPKAYPRRLAEPRMYLSDYTGRGVSVAVVDSGVHAAHEHVGGVQDGVAVGLDGSLDPDFVDRLGHGTAVAAAIREKAPAVGLIAIRVFWHSLSTDIRVLVRGIEEGCTRGARIINLSLGTSNERHRTVLEDAVRNAHARGSIIVAAADDNGQCWFPGDLDAVVPVRLDWACNRSSYRIVELGHRLAIATSGYPRDIPGVPRERNLKGLSFAVANATGFVARALEARRGATVQDTFELLAAGAVPVSLSSEGP